MQSLHRIGMPEYKRCVLSYNQKLLKASRFIRPSSNFRLEYGMAPSVLMGLKVKLASLEHFAQSPPRYGDGVKEAV